VLWHYILIGIACLVAGFWLGGKHGRRVKRNAVRELNTNSLDLLESKSKLSGIESKYADYQRKNQLLQLSLQQLKVSRAQELKSNAQAIRSNAQAVKSRTQVRKLQQSLLRLSKQQGLNQNILELEAQKSRQLAAQSHSKAMKATALARKATSHLKQLEKAILSSQHLRASMSPPYCATEPVRLSVIEQPRLRARQETVKQVSDRDSARLTRLRSSNEATGRPLN